MMGMLTLILCLRDVIEIKLGPHFEVSGFRAGLKLFFEDRVKNDGGRAGVLKALYIVDIARQRRGRRHQWRAQIHSKVVSR